MQIIHASIPAGKLRLVAQILAEMMRGEAVPFPPGEPDSWIAWAGGGSTELEIMPRCHLSLSVQTFDKQLRWTARKGSLKGTNRVHLPPRALLATRVILPFANAAVAFKTVMAKLILTKKRFRAAAGQNDKAGGRTFFDAQRR